METLVASLPIPVDVVERLGELSPVELGVHGHAELHCKLVHKLPVHQVRQPEVRQYTLYHNDVMGGAINGENTCT